MNALGVITAAGTSTRMGGFPKPLLRFGTDRFVERILATLEAGGIDERLVVVGYEAETVCERANVGSVPVAVNDTYESGMLSSVQLGVRRAQRLDVDAMYLWPVDYPCVSADIVESLWSTFLETGADVVLPSCRGERGHPALFGSATFDALLCAPESEGARAVVYSDETTVAELETTDERVLVDIDTPGEYWEAIKRYELDDAARNSEVA